MGRLDGKVAVITGAASGMGKASVGLFLREGARVVAADLNEANGHALVETFAAQGASERVDFIRADVSQEAQVTAMVGRARDRFGRLDVLFSNAGIGGAFGPITEISVEDWDFTQAVLLRSVFLGIKHAARILIAQGQGGSIINTASIAGISPGMGFTTYRAAKAAVIHFTKCAAVELAEEGIRVNVIAPGNIATAINAEFDTMSIVKKLQPLQRLGTPTDVANAAVYLASERAAQVTGLLLPVDGGTTLGPPPTFVGDVTRSREAEHG